MYSLLVNGGIELKGTVSISGAKNAALPIMAASLLVDRLRIDNVPLLTDITTMIKLLESFGARVTHFDTKNSLLVDTSQIIDLKASCDIVRKMRASIWVLAPLLARYGRAEVSLPGGCAIGSRQVDLHIAVLEAMGAVINVENGYIHASRPGKRLRATDFTFGKISVGATITGILASSLADGETILRNCAMEPEIVDLCNCLVKMGLKIRNIGTSEIIITGAESLDNDVVYSIMPDRIEAGTYMVAAAITKGDILIRGIDYQIIGNFASKLIDAGIEVTNYDSAIRVRYVGILKSVDIQTNPYPGIPTDLQAQFMALMSVASGVSVVTENIFENRFMHVPELARMGANIRIEGNNAIVSGVSRLHSADVMASDLRASVSLILAALIAPGSSRIRRIYHLDRGYEMLEYKLKCCGADVVRVLE